MAWRSWRNYYKDVAPFTVLVAMEFIIAGLNTLFKAATLTGMSYHVFMVYDYAFAALLLLPAPFFSYRSSVLPPLGFPVLRKIGLLALIGISCQITGYTGLIYSSPTLSSVMANLMPAFTFILAIFFRMEELVWSRSSSKAKVMGTIISITGALVVTLYKGPPIFKASKPSMSFHQPLNSFGVDSNWVIGGAFFTAQFTLIPLWFVVLTQIMEEYPAELTVIFFYNFCVCFMALVVALVVERNASAWRTWSDIALASVVCWGIFSSCMNNTVHSWALRLKGPVYVAMFKPFSTVAASALGIIFLGETPHLGSLIGATTISIGFYTVMWGKAKEATLEDSGSGSSNSTTVDPPSSQKVPLLQSYKNRTSVEPVH
ncbi:WAT1-related protein At3g28050-like [Hibiscus syriacus]|uniref:WAT1-related protein At3g28050-like n=1 Tax=Hibiscus syriacus TaxID=106335 RepID=UPI00192424FE|nr:WAT1-related protein At3g28050-like [Hibiscus syriacus]